MKNYYKLIVILLTSTIFASCIKDEFFELKHGPETPWTSLVAFDATINGAYNELYRVPWNAPLGTERFLDWHSSDLMQPGSVFNPVYYNRDIKTVVTDNMELGRGVWKCCYSAITACNDPLSWIEGKEAEGGTIFPEVSAEEEKAGIARIKAELYVIRAFSYHYLVEAFCPPYVANNSAKLIPLKTNFSENPDDLRATELASTKDVFDLMIADLKKAKELYSSVPGLKDYKADGRANYYVACGLLARTYFLMRDYDNAKAQCDEIINSGKFSLTGKGTEPIDAWNKDINNPENSPEVIWLFPQTPKTDCQDYLMYNVGLRWNCAGGGRGTNWSTHQWTETSMSYWALKYVDWMADPQKGDYTETQNAKIDKRYKQLHWRFEGYIPKPEGMSQLQYDTTYNYLSSAKTPHVLLDKWWRSPNGNTIGTKNPLMRVAEFYLTRSIIRFKSGDVTGAKNDLNVIRKRAGLQELITITEDDIHRERIKEFMGEGDRNRYCISVGLPLGAGDRPADKVVNPPYSDWYYNLPKSETDLNDAYHN